MRMLSETAAVALDLIVTFIICTGLLAAVYGVSGAVLYLLFLLFGSLLPAILAIVAFTVFFVNIFRAVRERRRDWKEEIIRNGKNVE